MGVIANIIQKIQSFFEVEQYCHKTALGYNCKHRVYQDGRKECQ